MRDFRPLKALRPTTSPSTVARLAGAPMAVVRAVEREIGRAFGAWGAEVLSRLEPFIERQFAGGTRFDEHNVWSAFQIEVSVNGEVLEGAWDNMSKRSAKATRRLAPVPVPELLPDGDRMRAEWLREQTDLIRGTERFRRKVEAIIANPINEGLHPRALAAKLRKELGVEKRRAELIARDQTLKTYGRLQKERQLSAGIKRYRWVTSRDERVRHRHRDLDNTVHLWSEPPIVDARTGRRGHPGEDFQCRCNAAPVLDEPETQSTEVAVQARRERRAREAVERRERVAAERQRQVGILEALSAAAELLDR